MTRGAGLAAACAALVCATAARADAPRRTLEVGVHANYGFMVFSSHAGADTVLSRRNGGPGGAVSVLLRSSYFLSPFLDVSFNPLYASRTQVDLGPLGLDDRYSTKRALGIIVGGAFDFRQFRLRAGIGSSSVFVRSRSDHFLSSREWDLTYFVSASGFVWKSPRLKVGLETRFGRITDAGDSFVTVGLVGGGDALSW